MHRLSCNARRITYLKENKKVNCSAKSSAEAEYRSMAATVSEVIWLKFLLTELGTPQQEASTLYCDNQVALHIAMNPIFHERTKHVEMNCYFVRERVQSKEIMPPKIWTDDQLANLFTKPLGKDKFKTLLSKSGIANLHAPT